MKYLKENYYSIILKIGLGITAYGYGATDNHFIYGGFGVIIVGGIISSIEFCMELTSGDGF